MVRIKLTDDGGQQFWCPGCDEPHALKGWTWNGSMTAPTFEPSVRVREYAGEEVIGVCHSYVTDGRIRFLDDSTHPLVGKTVDLPEWPR